MFITIHCGGLPFNGDTLKTSSLGGSETSCYYTAKALATLGHKVTVFTNCREEGVYDDVKYCYAGMQSEAAPLGDRFHFYAENTPCDVMIIQRCPYAFRYQWASKLNYLWLHDVPDQRFGKDIHETLYNIDGILCVSEYHKQQIIEAWGLQDTENFVTVHRNSVDLALISSVMAEHEKLGDIERGIEFVYSSRPERGLEHLVREGGIVDQLITNGVRFTLYVCCYDYTTPEMAEYYERLYSRVDELPNCVNLGHLTKERLYTLMATSDALLYPTEFDEVSCITIMEALACGLQIVASDSGAIRETYNNSIEGVSRNGSDAIIPLKNGIADEQAFVEHIKNMSVTAENVFNGARIDYQPVNAQLSVLFYIVLGDRAMNRHAALKDMYVNSDIVRLSISDINDTKYADIIEDKYSNILNASDAQLAQHYDAVIAEKDALGESETPVNLSFNPRFETISKLVSELPPGSCVLDYGCAIGHYTINLAKRYPDVQFIGVDHSARYIRQAHDWRKDEKIDNVDFYTTAEFNTAFESATFDMLLCCEVLEHVHKPHKLITKLLGVCKADASVVVTTPYGAWEYEDYDRLAHRQHVHCFYKADLHQAFCEFDDFNIIAVPCGRDSIFNKPKGSYVTVFKNTENASVHDHTLLVYPTNPTETVSVCIIAKDCGHTLGRTLESVKHIADEIIVGIDETTRDPASVVALCNEFNAKHFFIHSPIEIGFDAARNAVIDEAKCDWILWIDADEVLHNYQNLFKYLRFNQLNGLAIKQIHLSVDPAGVIKEDYPHRLFRNNKGIKFFGFVHEHPETEMNAGLGYSTLVTDVYIEHTGYATEAIRRKRFSRNLPLMIKDRELNPERMLGKYLWLRDLSLQCKYIAEQNGNQIDEHMRSLAKEGVEIWRGFLTEDNPMFKRWLLEGLEFYSILSNVLGSDLHIKESVKIKNRSIEFEGVFANTQDYIKFMKLCLNEADFKEAIVDEKQAI